MGQPPTSMSLVLVVGLAVAFAALWLRDRHRLGALMDWLAGPRDRPPPDQSGSFGELGSRMGRALRVREQEAAAERERLAQFLSAIEASPNGVVLLDGHDEVQWLNRTAAGHFGLDTQRDLGQRITHLVRAPAFVSHLQGGASDAELVLPSPRGDGTLSVLVRPYGEHLRLLLSQDITERERSDAMRRDFVANVSHEIRSPLTVLLGFVDSMRELPLSPTERERALTVMHQQAERMQTLVTDLLALAQIEGAPRPSVDHSVDIHELMRRLQTDIAASDAGQHAVTVTVEGAAQLSGVDSELFSAFWNLASNALRYTPPGGAVQVSWKLRPDRSGEFCVCDSGPGIAREHIPRLTERFYRVDPSRSRATGGTGLGLAIVKHVVQRHGGELLISSEPGKGSQFRIVLPAHRVREQPRLSAAV
ncbi:MAG: phosphate regulon sensor histidine kinase PhoR [Hylemonella sp.]|nr:phosphate regulon sensor histidine kinase PhoR [Hylemonella sp.]